jgi:hypothetical protein
MRRTLEWQIQRTGFLFRTSSVFLHGCVLFYFIFISFMVSFDARFGCYIYKKEAMHAAVNVE